MSQQSRFTSREQQKISDFAFNCSWIGAVGFEIHPSEVAFNKTLIEKLVSFGYIIRVEFTGSLPGAAKGTVYSLTEDGVNWLTAAKLIRQYSTSELAGMTSEAREALKGIKVADDFYTYWAC